MREIFAVLTVAFVLWSSVSYWAFMRSGKAKPVLATWLIFSVGNTLSLLSYLAGGSERNLLNGVANMAWTITTWITVYYVWKWQKADRKFSRFHVGCFVAAGLGTLLWALSENSVLGNIAFQGVMMAGYFPTFHRLWISGESTEISEPWLISIGAQICGSVPPLLGNEKEWLAVVYNGRGLLCVLAILYLIGRIKLGARAKT